MTLSPTSAQHQGHGERQPADDDWDTDLEGSFFNALDDGSDGEANSLAKNDGGHCRGCDHLDLYKCLPPRIYLIEDIKAGLRTQLALLEKTSSKMVELKSLFQDDTNSLNRFASKLANDSLDSAKLLLKSNLSVTDMLKNMHYLIEELNGLVNVADDQNTMPSFCPAATTTSMHDETSGQPGAASDELPELSTAEEETLEIEEASVTSEYTPVNAWNISTPGSDPFVDTPKKAEAQPAPVHLELSFHPDFTELVGCKLYVPRPKDDTSSGLRSRRVILKNLPPDATLAQVVKGVYCFGGIVSINLLHTAPIFGDSTKSALLEFVYPTAAAQYTEALQSEDLIYEAENGDRYRAAAWLVRSTSYAPSNNERLLLEKGQTRALRLGNFPPQAVWYFLRAVGAGNVTYANYDQEAETLVVEFKSLFEAGRVARLVWTGMFDHILATSDDSMAYAIVNDSSQAPSAGAKREPGIIGHVSRYILEEEWNRSPFNDYWPTEHQPVMQFEKLAPLPPVPAVPSRPSMLARLAAQYDIDEDEVLDYLEERKNHVDTVYRIVGSNITITRRKWSWRMTEEDETKLLMSLTLHDPEWADIWDAHFEATGQVNLRTWQQYGMLAKHRREKAAEQGLEEDGQIPVCDNCEFGCQDLKSAPVPAVIREYLDYSNFGRKDEE